MRPNDLVAKPNVGLTLCLFRLNFLFTYALFSIK
jgi:hypothetical protein